jgi:hypothetical protein
MTEQNRKTKLGTAAYGTIRHKNIAIRLKRLHCELGTLSVETLEWPSARAAEQER